MKAYLNRLMSGFFLVAVATLVFAIMANLAENMPESVVIAGETDKVINETIVYHTLILNITGVDKPWWVTYETIYNRTGDIVAYINIVPGDPWWDYQVVNTTNGTLAFRFYRWGYRLFNWFMSNGLSVSYFNGTWTNVSLAGRSIVTVGDSYMVYVPEIRLTNLTRVALCFRNTCDPRYTRLTLYVLYGNYNANRPLDQFGIMFNERGDLFAWNMWVTPTDTWIWNSGADPTANNCGDIILVPRSSEIWVGVRNVEISPNLNLWSNLFRIYNLETKQFTQYSVGYTVGGTISGCGTYNRASYYGTINDRSVLFVFDHAGVNWVSRSPLLWGNYSEIDLSPIKTQETITRVIPSDKPPVIVPVRFIYHVIAYFYGGLVYVRAVKKVLDIDI